MFRFVHSTWHEDAIIPTQDPLVGDVVTDVVVIGGGIAGLSAAYYLNKAGLKVILLERDAIGSEASTKNFGQITTVWDLSTNSEALSQRLASACQKTVPLLEQLILDESIDCDFKNSAYWFLVQKNSDVTSAKELVKKYKGWGFDVSWVEPEDVGMTTAPLAGGVRFNKQAVVNPYKLVQGLRTTLLRNGVVIHENSEVTEIVDGSPALVRTSQGSVTAEKVVVSANAYARNFGISQEQALPAHIFAVATKPLSAERLNDINCRVDQCSSDFGKRTEANLRYWHRLRGDGRLVFGGGSVYVPSVNDIFTPKLTEKKWQEVTAEMKRRFPSLTDDDMDYGWGGTISTTLGEKPLIGPLSDTGSIIFCLICNGKGVGLGTNAGRYVAEIIKPGSYLDDEEEDFLNFCSIPNNFRNRLEGKMMRLAQNGLARHFINTMFGVKSSSNRKK